jgi:hypothetical protein
MLHNINSRKEVKKCSPLKSLAAQCRRNPVCLVYSHFVARKNISTSLEIAAHMTNKII